MHDSTQSIFEQAIIGLDVHLKTITDAVLLPGQQRIEKTGTFPNNEKSLRNLLERLRAIAQDHGLVFVYEAGCMGYTLFHWLYEMGIDCRVIAPGSIPKKSNHQKDDTQDAIALARYFRNGDLSEVTVPDEEVQGLRGLVQLRGATVRMRTQTKNRIKHFQMIWNLKSGGGFGQDHLLYLCRAVKNLPKAAGIQLSILLSQLQSQNDQIGLLENELFEIAKSERFKNYHDALIGLKGISTVTAIALIASIIDINRFTSPCQLMAYWGLVPQRENSGEKVCQSHITKRGNVEVRRLLVESARNQFGSYVVNSKHSFGLRRKGLDPELCRIMEKAGYRLSRRARALSNRGKSANKIKVAIAREMAGWVWALLMKVEEVSSEKNAA